LWVAFSIPPGSLSLVENTLYNELQDKKGSWISSIRFVPLSRRKMFLTRTIGYKNLLKRYATTVNFLHTAQTINVHEKVNLSEAGKNNNNI
jgi:hypothetical protein